MVFRIFVTLLLENNTVTCVDFFCPVFITYQVESLQGLVDKYVLFTPCVIFCTQVTQ